MVFLVQARCTSEGLCNELELRIKLQLAAWLSVFSPQLSAKYSRQGTHEGGTPHGPQFGREFKVLAIDVAPAPGLAAFEGRNQRVPRVLEVLQRMHVLRVFAAPDVAAG
jgi:hypothetical protein